MAIQQPTSSNTLNSPDHSLSHRVFANDDAAPVQSLTVDSNGNVKHKYGLYENVTTITSGVHNVAITDRYIYGNAASGDITCNLPAATGSGRVLTVKKIDASYNLYTITANGADTIDGDSTAIISDQWTSATLQDAAAGVWYIN